MITKIKSIVLENFKGRRNATYEFDGSTKISGKNGVGKTTIATAWYWLISDRDVELHSNPKIRPIGAEEVTPRVIAVLEIDGREVTISKSQKCTVKKSKTGGADSILLSNSYEVNFVEFGERDFKKKLTEYGFDFDVLLPLSHPDVFLSKKVDDMRKVLFGMASEKTDKEIADLTEGAREVAEMLARYTMEEVKARQKATIRKIKEVYGDKGEILKATIVGMEKSKVDIDVAELELQKNDLKRQLDENEAKQDDISKQYEAYQKLSKEVASLKMQLSDMERAANEENNNNRAELQKAINGCEKILKDIINTIDTAQEDIQMFERRIKNAEDEIKICRDEWTTTNERVFDENSLNCPYCNQPLPLEKQKELKSTFDNKKADDLDSISQRGNEWKAQIDDYKKKIECLKDVIGERENARLHIEKQRSTLEKELENLPETIDISGIAECKEIQQQIADKESELQKYSSDNAQEILKAEYEKLSNQLLETEREIAKFENNMRIDEQIAELREKQGQYEQNKANAEKILYQLDLVSRRKNELLTEEINVYFDIVKWQLFEYQKNGEYKNCCVPLIDGKRFGESTNTGREVLAKLDIIKGLQRFYGQNYPVFLDGAECLSEETMKCIEMGCQIIYLLVSEDKELRIEGVI